jgi:Ni/Co efflux regulator RcnB
MKKILVSGLAALALASALPATASADPGWRQTADRDHDGRNDRHDRWDNRRDNGYYYNNRFYRGAPPAAYYGRPGFRPGYRAWSRGDRLPPGYHYTVVDYRGRYAPPPRGYHYVRDDRGDVLLAAIATGLIASVIVNH